MATRPGGMRPARPAAENDIYTALLLISFLFVIAAIAYVAYKSVSLFGGLLPPGGG